MKITFRQSTNSIGNLKGIHMSNFYGYSACRYGSRAAVSEKVRKLATEICNFITKRVSYNSPTECLFLYKKRNIAIVKKNMKNIANFQYKLNEVQNIFVR